MQRKPSKTKRSYTVVHSPEMLELALECMRKKQMSSYEAEKHFGIPRRTLLDKLKKKHDRKVGCPTRLSSREENEIIKVLIAASDFGSPLSLLDLRCMVHKYLQKNGRDIFKGKMPGEKWAYGFLKRHRHQLSLRVTSNIKKARAEKSCQEMRQYFNNLKESLLQVPKSNILNYDETNLSDDPGKSKCIVKRGTKYPERIMNHSKGCISIMFAATADGKMLAPYVVYKSKHMWTQWVTGGPPLARYNHSSSGWFDANLFEDWFVSIVIPWATKLPGPKLVVGDNLASHLNPEIVSLCEQHNIRFVLLPTNSTHLTQPLDVCVYGPLKRLWRKILTQFKIENPSEKALNKCRFPGLLTQVMDELSKRENNVVSAFATTGIYPFNPETVLKRLPDYTEPADYGVGSAVIDYLTEIRTPKRKETPARNKKLNIQPGKSVTANDFAFSVNLGFKIKPNKTGNIAQATSNDTKISVTSNILIKSPEKQNGNNASKTPNKKNTVVQNIDSCFEQNAIETPESPSVVVEHVGITCDPKTGLLYNVFNEYTSDEDVSTKTKVITPKKRNNREDEDTDEEVLTKKIITLKKKSKKEVEDTDEVLTKKKIITQKSKSKIEDENTDEEITIKKKVITSKKKIKKEDDDTDEEGDFSVHDSSYDYEEEDGYYVEEENDFEEDETDVIFGDDEIPCNREQDKTPSEGNYLLVRFHSERGTIKHFVGKVVKKEDENNFKLKFLRHKGRGKFAWPINDDFSVINKIDIEEVLPEPISERRGILTFDISKWFHFIIG